MKKQQFSLEDFRKNELNLQKSASTKGGRTRIRRNGQTGTAAIWDEVDIRDGNNQPGIPGIHFKSKLF